MTGRSHDEHCFGFLRRFAAHLAAFAAGQLPAHAATCAACRARLDGASRIAALLRQRPPVPEPMHDAKFDEAVLERVIDASSAAPVGAALRAAWAAPLTAPAETIAEEIDAEVARHLNSGIGSPPSWMWLRIRDQVRRDIGSRLRLTRIRWAAFIGAAAVALIGASLWSSLANGTKAEPTIVFVTMTDLPPVEYPTAVLRNGFR